MPPSLTSGEFFSTVTAFVWAIAVILFKRSGSSVPPVALNLFKNVLAIVLLVPTLLVVGVSFVPDGVTWDQWALLLGSGFVGIGVADTIFFMSLNRLGAGRSAIVDCLYSPLVILLSALFLMEPLDGWLFVAVGLMVGAIFIGTWNPKGVTAPEDKREIHRGVALGSLAMLLMAAGIVMAKPVLDETEVWWATIVRLVGGVIPLVIQGSLRRHRAQVKAAFTPNRSWRVTVPAAFLGTYLAMLFWIAGMKYTYTTVASVLNQLSTIFILVLATAFLKEPLTWRKAVAIAMGFVGGALAAL